MLPFWLLSWFLLLALSLVQGFVLYFIGDIARYLDPSRENIKIRQAIRADGIKLLKKLYESGSDERVIVIGHSLGSFIAYDILKHLWHYTTYNQPRSTLQEALAVLEQRGASLKEPVSASALQGYRNAQIELWKELRSLGNPWLVTDLIIMGSPLTHAVLVLAKDERDLRRARQHQCDLPTNPPVPEKQEGINRYSFEPREPYTKEGETFHLRAFIMPVISPSHVGRICISPFTGVSLEIFPADRCSPRSG